MALSKELHALVLVLKLDSYYGLSVLGQLHLVVNISEKYFYDL